MEYYDFKIETIYDEVDVRTESMKGELDNKRETIFNKLAELRQRIREYNKTYFNLTFVFKISFIFFKIFVET